MVDCCPSPNNPVIVPSQKTESQRKALYALMYGEIGAALCRAYTFGFLTGLLHLISMWIDYLGYATMHYCQVIVIGCCGAMEVLMLWMNINDGGPIEEMIYESSLTIATFYVMLIFSAIKAITGFYVYSSFKREYTASFGSSGNDFWNDGLDNREQAWYNNQDQNQGQFQQPAVNSRLQNHQDEENRQNNYLRQAQVQEQQILQNQNQQPAQVYQAPPPMQQQQQAQPAQNNNNNSHAYVPARRLNPNSAPRDFADIGEVDLGIAVKESQPQRVAQGGEQSSQPAQGYRMPNTLSDAELLYQMQQNQNHAASYQREWQRRNGAQ